MHRRKALKCKTTTTDQRYKFLFHKIIVAVNGTLNVGNENDEHDGTLAIIFINIFFGASFFLNDEKKNQLQRFVHI